jgi:hypothetical protein
MGPQLQLLPSYLRYGVSAAAGFLAFGLLHKWSTIRQASRREPVRSPRQDISPSLSQEEIGNLPYPPDIFPGGRDVETPYGFIRVFEWGPEDGRKVLLVHGISTPAMSLGGLAGELVQKGCRVMLFGRFCFVSLENKSLRLLSQALALHGNSFSIYRPLWSWLL